MQHTTMLEAISSAPQEAIALLSPEKNPTTFGQLYRFIGRTAQGLWKIGVRQDSRIAVVVPEGHLLATSVLCGMAAAAVHPVDPSSTAPELRETCQSLRASHLFYHSDTVWARDIARELEISAIQVEPDDSGLTGFFCLREADGNRVETIDESVDWQHPDPDGVAIYLFTSGTMKKKLVPLLHGKLAVSAFNISESLELTEGDTSLVVMPLFHVHGLIAALFAALYKHGRAYICPGYRRSKIVEQMQASGFTWMTASPGVYTYICNAVDEAELPIRHAIAALRVRIARSASEALTAGIRKRIRDMFGKAVSIWETLGMTELHHQGICNRRGANRPFTLGKPSHTEVRIVNVETGRIVGVGEIGEIQYRGLNVFTGYVNDPEATAEAFTADGWFRSGDLGWFDKWEHVRFFARMGDVINRRGTKINPRLVEAVALQHEFVADAAVYAVPGEHLASEVGMSIVLAAGVLGEPNEVIRLVRDHMLTRIKRVMVPLEENITIESYLDKTAVGKTQRRKTGIRVMAARHPQS